MDGDLGRGEYKFWLGSEHFPQTLIINMSLESEVVDFVRFNQSLKY